MIVKGGYLKGTDSIRAHPIVDITVLKSNLWNRVTVTIGKTVLSFGNTGTSMSIKLKGDDNYNMNLVVNNKVHYSERTLYEYDVEVDSEDEKLIVKTQNMFYDS